MTMVIWVCVREVGYDEGYCDTLGLGVALGARVGRRVGLRVGLRVGAVGVVVHEGDLEILKNTEGRGRREKRVCERGNEGGA